MTISWHRQRLSSGTYVQAMLFLAAFPLVTASAHPVPQKRHDGVIAVSLTASGVIVRYRLEVDPWTIVNEDVPALLDESEWSRLRIPSEWYAAFVRAYAPVLTDGVSLTLDGTPMTVRCREYRSEVLDHVRCEFVFLADWDVDRLSPRETHRMILYDGTYELEDDALTLTLDHESPILLESKTEPPVRLRDRPSLNQQPGDDRRRRTVEARFRITAPSVAETGTPPKTEAVVEPVTSIGPVAGVVLLAVCLLASRRLRQSMRQPTTTFPES